MLKLVTTRLRDGAWIAVALAALGAVLGVLVAIDRQADRHLAADAERAALGWARHIAANVPDIDLVFAGDLPSPQAQERLIGLRGTAGLFRFKLYDPDGQLLVVSDSVGTAPRPEDSRPEDRAKAVRAAREETRLIELHRGGVDRPEVYSEAYVPVRHGRQVIGVVDLQLVEGEAP